jgi:hypothetical protein
MLGAELPSDFEWVNAFMSGLKGMGLSTELCKMTEAFVSDDYLMMLSQDKPNVIGAEYGARIGGVVHTEDAIATRMFGRVPKGLLRVVRRVK